MIIKKFFITILVVVFGLPLYIPMTTAKVPEIKINIHQAKHVSRMVFGWHYEEIGMIGDGGLYAELVRNRNFEEATLPAGLEILNGHYVGVPNPNQPIKHVYQIDPLVGWRVLPLTNAATRIKITDRNPLNAESPHSMLVSVLDNTDLSKGIICNTGYYGMGIKSGNKYHLSLYAYSKGYNGKLEVRLADSQGRACSKLMVINLDSIGWQQYSVFLTAFQSDSAGMLQIIPTAKGSFQLDMVSLFPTNTWDNGKSVFRADVLKNLKDYRPDFLRFPGGCIVHGVNEQTMYHWKQTIGDPAKRPGGWSKWEPHYRTDGIGFHEFLQLCEYIGADGMYVVPVGMPCPEWVYPDNKGYFKFQPVNINNYIQDALDAIEYAIGPVNSRWGSERAKNGHPKPFPLKYIEIGNEDYGPVYYERYHQIYHALKEKYPNLIYIANLDAQNNIEKFSNKDELEYVDEHFYKNIPWAIKNFHRFDSYKRQGIGLYVAELGIQSNGVGGPIGQYPNSILAEGIFKLGMERNGDLKPIMADRPLMRNWDCIDRNDMQPLILNTSNMSIKTFNYSMCKMLRDNTIDEVYNVRNEEGENFLFVTAGRDNRKKQIVVKVINLKDSIIDISLSGLPIKRHTAVEITTLSANTNRRNTPVTPDLVMPHISNKVINKDGNIITVPAHSLCIYRINN